MLSWGRGRRTRRGRVRGGGSSRPFVSTKETSFLSFSSASLFFFNLDLNQKNPKLQKQERFASYDFLSAGMGALAVTSYCVWRGQDPLTALSITAASTVTALVANELLLEAERKQQ